MLDVNGTKNAFFFKFDFLQISMDPSAVCFESRQYDKLPGFFSNSIF